MLDLVISCVALAFAAIALARAYVPPQQRQVHELRGRVEDLELAHEDVRTRLTRRARQEGLDQARQVKTGAAAERDALADQARQLLAAQAAAGQATAATAGSKDELRRRFGLVKG